MRRCNLSRRSLKPIALLLSLVLLLGACSSDKEETSVTPTTTTSEATTVEPTPTPTPNCPDQVIIANGDIEFGQIIDGYYLVDCDHADTVDLAYNIQPRDVNVAVEEWSSSDETVATVSGSGTVTPIGYGECEITLHVSDGLSDGATTSIHVTVQDGIIEIEDLVIPSYEELKTNIENTYGSSNMLYTSYSYGMYTNFESLPFIGCEHCSGTFYTDYPFEELIYGMNCRYKVFKSDEYILIIDGNGITIRCDEYLLFIYAYYGNIDDSLAVAESVGIHIPVDSLNLDDLK